MIEGRQRRVAWAAAGILAVAAVFIGFALVQERRHDTALAWERHQQLRHDLSMQLPEPLRMGLIQTRRSSWGGAYQARWEVRDSTEYERGEVLPVAVLESRVSVSRGGTRVVVRVVESRTEDPGLRALASALTVEE